MNSPLRSAWRRLRARSLPLEIAWRHLRCTHVPRWSGPLAAVAGVLAFAGALALAWSSGQESVVVGEEFSAAGLVGLAGALGLAVGLLLLGFAVIVRRFTLLVAITVYSVAQGCAALIIVLSLLGGLETDLRDRLLGHRAHLRVSPPAGAEIVAPDSLVAAIRALPAVAGVSPSLEGPVMVRSGFGRAGVTLVGIDPALHREASGLPDEIIEGDYRFFAEPGHLPARPFPGEEPPPAASSGEADGDQPTDDSTDDGGWEDPEQEIPRLRADGKIPPARAPAVAEEPDADARVTPGPGETGRSERPGPRGQSFAGGGDVVDAPRGGAAGDGAEGRDLLPDASDRAQKTDSRSPPAGDEDDGGGWEDPEQEIPRLRAAGKIPPARSPAGAEGPEPEAPEPEASPAAPLQPAAPGRPVLVPVLLGVELAGELGVGVGDPLQLITPEGRLTPAGLVPGVLAARVAAVYATGIYDDDRDFVYVPLADAQAFLRAPDAATALAVRLRDPDALAAGKAAIAGVTREPFVVEDWRQIHRGLFSAMFLEKVAMFVGLLFVILVAAFGILATNLMSVMERAAEIAILKALGARDRLIGRVFALEGCIVGGLGCLGGIAAGLALCRWFGERGVPIRSSAFTLEALPLRTDPWEVALVAAAALLLVGLASVVPAGAAASVRPVDGLRRSE